MRGTVRALVLAVFALSSACATVESETARQKWWSGPWWPEHGTDPHLYDPGEAMDVYWQYVTLTRAPAAIANAKNAMQEEARPHGCSGAVCSANCGHCHAFSAAALRETEPTKPIKKTIVRMVDAQGQPILLAGENVPPGREIANEAAFRAQAWPQGATLQKTDIVFRVRHQKGLLTELWYFFPTDSEGSANHLNGPSVTPRKFHEGLQNWLRDGAGIDLLSSDLCAHHPLYSYRSEWSQQRDATGTVVRHYTTTVTAIDYSDGDDTEPKTMNVVYEYEVPWRNSVAVGDGTWLSQNRPGAIWKPKDDHRSGNVSVSKACVDEIRKGDETIYILSDRDYRPWPCG